MQNFYLIQLDRQVGSDFVVFGEAFCIWRATRRRRWSTGNWVCVSMKISILYIDNIVCAKSIYFFSTTYEKWEVNWIIGFADDQISINEMNIYTYR